MLRSREWRPDMITCLHHGAVEFWIRIGQLVYVNIKLRDYKLEEIRKLFNYQVATLANLGHLQAQACRRGRKALPSECVTSPACVTCASSLKKCSRLALPALAEACDSHYKSIKNCNMPLYIISLY